MIMKNHTAAPLRTATRRLLTKQYYRALSPCPPGAVPLHRHHRVHLLFGANTDVGKSVVSAGLLRAASASSSWPSRRQPPLVRYIKPLQCGGSDEKFVQKHREDGALRAGDSVESPQSGDVECETLFRWETPASPHLASRWENLPVSDDEVISSLKSSLNNVEDDAMEDGDMNMRSVTIIETAGGVLSPSSSSPFNKSTTDNHWGWTTQADLYAPLDFPVIFVGDGKLGGISVTLSSLEALWSRGYRVDAVVFIEGEEEDDERDVGEVSGGIRFGRYNTEALCEYIAMQNPDQMPTSGLSSGAKNFTLDDISIICLPSIPPIPIPLDDWYKKNDESFTKLHHLLCHRWMER
ncbi:hypothetical protein ACHAWF_012538 [Thalassiosira exigua]